MNLLTLIFFGGLQVFAGDKINNFIDSAHIIHLVFNPNYFQF